MTTKRGRPSLEYDEAELFNIVRLFRENVKPNGIIKYSEIYRYHLELHEESPDICTRTYKEDFWKRTGQPGRKVIDVANSIRTEKIVSSKSNTKEIPNLVDVIDRYSNNPEKLFSHLEPLVATVRSSSNEISSLQEENEKLKSSNIELKEEIRGLKQQVRLLEDSIYKLFNYSEDERTPLENLLDMNNANKRIKRALEQAFTSKNIQDLYHQVSNSAANEKEQEQSNVVQFDKNRSLADEFEDMF